MVGQRRLKYSIYVSLVSFITSILFFFTNATAENKSLRFFFSSSWLMRRRLVTREQLPCLSDNRCRLYPWTDKYSFTLRSTDWYTMSCVEAGAHKIQCQVAIVLHTGWPLQEGNYLSHHQTSTLLHFMALDFCKCAKIVITVHILVDVGASWLEWKTQEPGFLVSRKKSVSMLVERCKQKSKPLKLVTIYDLIIACIFAFATVSIHIVKNVWIIMCFAF